MMIFLKRYKKFTHFRYANCYGRVTIINDLGINFAKYSTKNNSRDQTICNDVLKSCITRDIQTRNIDGREVIDYEKIATTYDVTCNIYDNDKNNFCIIYSITIYDYKKYKILELNVKKTKYSKTANAEQKILRQKQINYNKFLNIPMYKWCVVL